MKNLFQRNIYFKVGMILFIGLLFPALIMGFIEFKNLEKQLVIEERAHIKDSTDLMAFGLSRALWDFSLVNVEPIVKASLSNSEIINVTVYDQNGDIFYQENPTGTEASSIAHEEAHSLITHNEKIIGRVVVEYTLKKVYVTLRQHLFSFIIMRILQLILALGMLLAFLYWSFIRRLNRLSTQAKKLDQQVLNEPFSWEPGDPIDELGMDLERARQSLSNLFVEVKVTNFELSQLNIELENKVKEKTQRIVHSARMIALGEMAAGVAHEINNPLTVIMTRSKMMLNGLKTDRYTKDESANNLQKIITMSARIDKIVKSLRSFSGNSEKEQMKHVPLTQIFTDTFDLCQEKLKSNNIELKISPLPDLQVECRSIEISQVLLNLINNASDAIKDLDEKWISIEASIDKKNLQVRVSDSGTGIGPEIATKIMLPFFTTKAVDQGTGLGLSIASGIIEEHHGRLWLDQFSNHTSFVFQIPIHRPQ